MQMCSCLKEHMREVIGYVFCALCMVCLGSAVSWSSQDCNRQSRQRVANTWSTRAGLWMLGHKCSFLDSGRKKQQKVLRHWPQKPALPFQKLFILPLSWVILNYVSASKSSLNRVNLWLLFFCWFPHGKRAAWKKLRDETTQKVWYILLVLCTWFYAFSIQVEAHQDNQNINMWKRTEAGAGARAM